MSNGDKEKKSFWGTLPGLLTGCAALLTAVGGLLTVLYTVGVIFPPTPTPTPTIPIVFVTPPPTTPPPPPPPTEETHPPSPTEETRPPPPTEETRPPPPTEETDPPPPPPTEEPIARFSGYWANVDPNTGGITRIEIQPREGTIFVHMWGKCHPTDCDWGEVATEMSDADDGNLLIMWPMSFKVESQQLTLLPDERLQLDGLVHYTDNSGRADRDYVEFFKPTDAPRPEEPPEERPSPSAQGALEIPQTWTVDLDQGLVGAGGEADLWFHAITAVERYLEPQGGARLAIVGSAAVGPDGCAAASLSTARIPIDDLTAGSYVCVLTNLGRYAEFRVESPAGPSPGALNISYTTW